jgi:hypothetical protein
VEAFADKIVVRPVEQDLLPVIRILDSLSPFLPYWH